MTVHKKIPTVIAAVLLLGLTSCGSAAESVNENGVTADIDVEAAEDNTMNVSEQGVTRSLTGGILGGFSTQFNPKNENRSKNIERASNAINQHVVQPGEVFSYNETVGPTSKKNGYKLGTVFIKGKISEGYGGGVCQVSSTLYNAAANAGMTIVERHDHSMPVPYIETGKDAATSYGGIDFKFKNNKNYPVRIDSAVKDGNISISLSAV